MSQQMQQTQSWTNSLFIPRVDFNTTKPEMKRYFEDTCNMGTVSRVDFVSFNNEKGTGRRAFVHFSDFKDEQVKETLLTQGKLDINMNGYNIRLVVNEKPVPETKLNLNQVAHNTEFIGEEVKVQQEKIEKMEAQMKQMEEQMVFMMDTIAQLQMRTNPVPVQQHTYIPFPQMPAYQQMMQPMYPVQVPIQEGLSFIRDPNVIEFAGEDNV